MFSSISFKFFIYLSFCIDSTLRKYRYILSQGGGGKGIELDYKNKQKVKIMVNEGYDATYYNGSHRFTKDSMFRIIVTYQMPSYSFRYESAVYLNGIQILRPTNSVDQGNYYDTLTNTMIFWAKKGDVISASGKGTVYVEIWPIK